MRGNGITYGGVVCAFVGALLCGCNGPGGKSPQFPVFWGDEGNGAPGFYIHALHPWSFSEDPLTLEDDGGIGVLAMQILIVNQTGVDVFMPAPEGPPGIDVSWRYRAGKELDEEPGDDSMAQYGFGGSYGGQPTYGLLRPHDPADEWGPLVCHFTMLRGTILTYVAEESDRAQLDLRIPLKYYVAGYAEPAEVVAERSIRIRWEHESDVKQP